MKLEQLTFRMMEFYAGEPRYIQHFIKVHGFARTIGIAEGIDGDTLYILEAAALVHDIGIKPSIEKYGSGSGKYQEVEGPPEAEKMLRELGCPRDVIERVCYLVSRHHTYQDIDGIDYQILVEADFLVNLYEKDAGTDAVQSALSQIFRTETGKQLCKTMFLAGQ